jgi:hypothetical protein
MSEPATIDDDTSHGWEIAGRNLTVERLNAEIGRLKAERDTYQRASTYWWRHYCEAIGRESHTTVAADAEFVRELDELKRKAALWDGAPVNEWIAIVEASRKVVREARSDIGVDNSFEGRPVLRASSTIPIRFVADLEDAVRKFDESY